MAVVNLFEDEMVAIMAPHHSLSLKHFLTNHDLADTKLITTTKLSAQIIRHMGKDVPETVATAMFIDQPNAIIELVKAGLGISFAPRWAVRSFLDSGLLTAVPLGLHGIHPVWKIVYLKEKTLPPYRQKFIDLLIKQQAVRYFCQ